MKLHKKLGPAILSKLGPWIVRGLGSTWRLRIEGRSLENDKLSKTGVLYCFWHGDLMVPAYAHRGRGTVVLVSGHRDGMMLGKILDNLGFSCVVGSITRGGALALRGLLTNAKKGADLCVPPDGPKGPIHKAKKGVLYLASRSGLPVIPAGIAASSAWRLRSWDRMLIPKPFSKVIIYVGEAMHVPPDIDGEELNQWALKLELAINKARDTAAELLTNKDLKAGASQNIKSGAEGGHVSRNTSATTRA
ncbi:MAG: lysophospholipid acyltransferase family protein [Planctomycetota bacterium]